MVKLQLAAQARVGARPLTCFRFGMVKLQRFKAHKIDRQTIGFRFGMVKLQRETFVRREGVVEKFPLWHGKVATLCRFHASEHLLQFPLWHGKVATQCWRCGGSGEF